MPSQLGPTWPGHDEVIQFGHVEEGHVERVYAAGRTIWQEIQGFDQSVFDVWKVMNSEPFFCNSL